MRKVIEDGLAIGVKLVKRFSERQVGERVPVLSKPVKRVKALAVGWLRGSFGVYPGVDRGAFDGKGLSEFLDLKRQGTSNESDLVLQGWTERNGLLFAGVFGAGFEPWWGRRRTCCRYPGRASERPC